VIGEVGRSSTANSTCRPAWLPAQAGVPSAVLARSHNPVIPRKSRCFLHAERRGKCWRDGTWERVDTLSERQTVRFRWRSFGMRDADATPKIPAPSPTRPDATRATDWALGAALALIVDCPWQFAAREPRLRSARTCNRRAQQVAGPALPVPRPLHGGATVAVGSTYRATGSVLKNSQG
jgi:hypothetical protein